MSCYGTCGVDRDEVVPKEMAFHCKYLLTRRVETSTRRDGVYHACIIEKRKNS